MMRSAPSLRATVVAAAGVGQGRVHLVAGKHLQARRLAEL